MDDVRFRIVFGFLRVIECGVIEVALFKGPDGFIPMRAVLLEEARFVFAHPTGDFFARFVQSGIHVFSLGVRLNRDVVGAEKNDLGDVPVFLNVEDDLGFDDARVVQMKTFNLLDGVLAQGIGHLFVPHRDGDRQVDVGSLHDVLGSGLQVKDERVFPLHPVSP